MKIRFAHFGSPLSTVSRWLRRAGPFSGRMALLVLTTASAGAGLADGATLCDRAAQAASRKTGVPVSVLRAITRTETGRTRHGKFAPWPWTVNMEGRGRWFATRSEAVEFAQAGIARGARSFDVGCFQINYRWHGAGFSSLDEMMEPQGNAIYAAQFLKRLHRETGDWSLAAGAYHSRTPELAARYRDRFDELYAGLVTGNATSPLRAHEDTARRNAFPFLQGGTSGRLGSLVPADRGARAAFVTNAGSRG